jgi:transcriptional regulator with XRE-family HTH domain
MKIGEKIKRRRTELKWSQRELAEKMGYNHSTITRIETGKIDIPQSRIVQFSEVLDVSVAYLMGWEDEEMPIDNDRHSENMKKLIEFCESVPEEKIDLVLKLMQTIVESD